LRKKFKKLMTFRKAFLLSFLLHVILLGGGVGFGCSGKGGDKTDGTVQFDAVDKNKGKRPDNSIQVELEHRQIVDNPRETSDGSTLPRDKSGTQSVLQISRRCPDGKWFGGIGVEIEYRESAGWFGSYHGVVGIVTHIFAGYPASRSNLQVGDFIFMSDDERSYKDKIEGKPGTTATLRVIRPSDSTDEFTVGIVREKICFKEKKR
jgi:hypothetical protein